MKKIKILSFRPFFRVILFLGCIALIQNIKAQSSKDSSQSEKLFNELNYKDSLLFDAVLNTCNIKQIEALLTKDFEFYPDKGELIPGTYQKLEEFIGNIKKNFCDKKTNSAERKIRREIEQGSLQVYPLKDHEVLQTGVQHFYVITPGQKDKLLEVSKFTRTWQKKDGEWKMSKEFDAFANTYANHSSNELYDTIAHMDSVLFNAFNAHNLDKLKTLFTDDLEFYHDLGGLTNYAQNMEAFKNNFAKNNGLRRELVPGSLEVYPVKDYGAIEIGAHKFCHIENGRQDCGTFKFAMVWQKKDGEWKISRVVSYGH
jgi:hypothetical protein